MALLGLFTRRDDKALPPVPPLYSLPSSSKLRLPFRRKHTPSDAGTPNDSVDTLPRLSLSDHDSHKKPPALFAWARERTKSRPSPPPPPPPADSFNLRAFRHVRADPPDPLLAPPRPRPRGDSVASDASQRISIAAFKEAQARSRANSPAPSFRPTSTADTIRVDAGRKRASTVSVVSGSQPVPRPDPSASDSSSDTSDSEDDEDVDSDGQPIPGPARKRTITRRVPPPPDPVPDPAVSAPPPDQSDHPPFTRQRASVSTSALIPNAATCSASALAETAPNESPHDSDSDAEDMPLSDLVAPRRPGSPASSHSNIRPRVPPKPLIDINTLAGGPPLTTPILRHQHSLKNTKGKEPLVEKDQPFSIPAALALPPSISPSNSASPAPNRRFSADVPSPLKPDNDDDLVTAIRLVGALDKELDQRPDRIVPTPIRAREPPTSFTVLSRPPQRQSIIETSASSPSRLSLASLSPPPDMGPRQRASTMINSPSQKDKSDTTSVVSTAHSSTSRTSSRIPPVPLIRTIPDSPSVTGRPRSESHTSMIITARSQPSSSKISPHHGLPRRPFASNSSIAGESPAGSSTGDSSSGRAPFTPRDGSDIGVRSKGDASDADSTLKARGHPKKATVTFEDQPARGRERTKMDLTHEQRTRERRRSEAKAALELGKIVNGRGPLGHDSDEDAGLRGHNPTINVTMEGGAQGMVQPGWPTWQQPMAPPPFGSDPAFFAAHQRALLIAKQAYQMAVAQHAMQMAGEEWERSSNAGFGSGGSVYGGGSGGSVYGGGRGGGSVYGGMPPMGMMGMPDMGMLMPPNPWAARSSIVFPSAGSAYGGMSSSQSEYGGGWDTQSVYGESFGSSGSARESYGGANAAPRPRAWTGVSPPSSSSSRPSGAAKGQVQRGRAAPPSSWKSGR